MTLSANRLTVGLILTVALLTPLAGHEQGTDCCGGQHEDTGTAGPEARVTPQTSIDDLAKLLLPDVRLTSVHHRETLPASDAIPNSKAIGVSHVNVHGVIGRAIGFDLNLPDRWNGRIVMGGGGGLVGNCEHAARGALEGGYATVGTDTGHVSPTPFTADWALFDAEAQVNFGHLAVHRTIEVAKAIVTAYYKRPADFTYFMGCSTGGRQALMEAQRYPRDFDGIVCGGPVPSMTGEMATVIHYAQHFFPHSGEYGNPVLSEGDLRKLQQEVLDQCDGQDGVEDGILDDPRTCRFDLAKVAWLTPKQRKAIRAAYEGPHAGGASIYPGVPLGSEAEWHEWFAGYSAQFMEQHNAPNMSHLVGTQFCKYFIFHDDHWDYSTYDLAKWADDSKFVSAFLDPLNPDLDDFRAAGGKLILWHGWSDGMATPLASVQYYEEVERRDPDVRDFFRLFMLPGVGHCGGGVGPDHVDWLAVVAKWVERGNPPFRIVARKRDETGVSKMSRPVYPYPLRAVYRGSGSANDAANWELKASGGG
jgi:pimeloyl-ACP methyl ester carboxylesterase